MVSQKSIRWDYVAILTVIFLPIITSFATYQPRPPELDIHGQPIVDPFHEAWEAARQNSLSWLYPRVLVSGVVTIIALSILVTRWLRRLSKTLVLLGHTVLATQCASYEIQEKWRLRIDWMELHPSQVRADFDYSNGAILSAGPLIFGLLAFLLFATTAGTLSVIRHLHSEHARLSAARDSHASAQA